MFLSKYYKKIKLKNNIYAVFNSLVMDVLYVNNDELENIEKKENLSKNTIKELMQSGIIVNDEDKDIQALNIIKNKYDIVTGNIHIMYLILSSACNLACKYCFIENCSLNNKKEINMSNDTVLSAIDKYDKYIKKNDITDALIIFYGGEPMVNWEAIETAVKYRKENKSNIKFSMVTNGTLLDEEKIKFLAKNKIEVGISIDGPKEINDKNRIYRNSDKSVYDQIINKFPLLKAENCKFGLSITISEDFLKIQDEVLDWLEKLGVSSIFYNMYHYTYKDANWESYYQDASKFLIKSYERLSKRGIYDGRIYRKIESVLKNEFKFSDCGAIGGNQLTIKPNGDVCVCHGYFKTDKYVVGNIDKQSIEEILEDKEFDFWKKRCTINNNECLNCEALFICGGGCALQAESLFDNREVIDKPFCIHTKESLKWVLQQSYDSMNK